VPSFLFLSSRAGIAIGSYIRGAGFGEERGRNPATRSKTLLRDRELSPTPVSFLDQSNSGRIQIGNDNTYEVFVWKEASTGEAVPAAAVTETSVNRIYFDPPKHIPLAMPHEIEGADVAATLSRGPEMDFDYIRAKFSPGKNSDVVVVSSSGHGNSCEKKWEPTDHFMMHRELSMSYFSRFNPETGSYDIECSFYNPIDENDCHGMYGQLYFENVWSYVEIFAVGDYLPETHEKPPTTSPTPSPTDATDQSTSTVEHQMIFSGHNEVISIETGSIDVSWSSAFVYKITEEEEFDRFVDDGEYNYYVIVAEGGRTFSASQTIDDIIALPSSDPSVQVFPTSNLKHSISGLEGGQLYSVLVVARSSGGRESYNRQAASIEASEFDLTQTAGVSEVKVLPEPDDAFTVFFGEDETGGAVRVEISGTYPSEYFDEVDVADFAYVFGEVVYETGQNSEATMKLLQVVDIYREGSSLHWICQTKKLFGDIFQQLDLNAEIGDSAEDLDSLEDLVDNGDLADDVVDQMLENLPPRVKNDLCISLGDLACFDSDDKDDDEDLFHRALGVNRNLRRRRRRKLRNFFRKVKRAAKKVRSVVKKAVDKVVEVVDKVADLSATLDKTITFLDVEKSAKLECRKLGFTGTTSYQTAIEVGIILDMSAKTRFKMKIHVRRGIDTAMLKLFGGFGAKSYIQLGATATASYAPDPVTLFKKSKTKVYWAGYIPVVVTNRPAAVAYFNANAAVEAEAFVSAQMGWDYSLVFEYDGSKSGDAQFKTREEFVQRPIFDEDPQFSSRLALVAKLGILFSWDIVLYGAVQARLAADVGSTAEMTVGTNLESIVLTPDCFYVLEKIDIKASINVQATLGLNSAIKSYLNNVVSSVSLDAQTCDITVNGGFIMPTFENDGSAPGLPKALEDLKKFALGTPECTDTHNWVDVDGFGCDFYQSHDDPGCPEHGYYWEGSMGVANDNCCHCGGGSTDGSIDVSVLTLEGIRSESGLPDDFAETVIDFPNLVKDFIKKDPVAIEIYSDEWSIFSLPEFGVEIESTQYEYCQGDHAVVMTLRATNQDDAKDGEWFRDFDGSIITENTEWIILSESTTDDTVMIALPMSALNSTIDVGMSIIRRTTPRFLPWPKKSMYTKFDISAQRLDIPDIECCTASDCGSPYDYTCGSDNKCYVNY